MAPSRGLGFDGQLFFVYNREAVTKESDPPENAIIYFYPPSASIEYRVSICGQLVGVSNFLTTVLDFAPVLIKLKTEKVALYQSGKYTMALGGSSTEPDSLLLRQLNALFRVFAFYHGSFENVQKFFKDHASFLSNMTIIWDCYLPFIRFYGDTLPAVFDPLPFLKTPKNSSGCFLKASQILQACQRRRRVLGGCILYKKSVLFTQLEPCITRRLLLLKPNQSHHPAKQVRTEINLPFGVRILHSFLTLSEYKRLIKELSRSPYHQNITPQEAEENQGKETDSSDGERFNGLLHKSVRKRIECESQERSNSRGIPSKCKSRKATKRRGKESIKKENASFFGKEDSKSTSKYEFSQNRLGTKGDMNILHKNDSLSSEHRQMIKDVTPAHEGNFVTVDSTPVQQNDQVAIDSSAVLQDDSVTVDNTPVQQNAKVAVDSSPVHQDDSVTVDNTPVQQDDPVTIISTPVHQDEPVNTDLTPEEVQLEIDKPDKNLNNITPENENFVNTADEDKEGESCTKAPLRKDREVVLEVECLYSPNSNGIEGTTDVDDSNGSGEELTMDEVNVKDLRVVTCADAQNALPRSTISSHPYAGQIAAINQPSDTRNGQVQQTASYSLDMNNPINDDHVCEETKDSFIETSPEVLNATVAIGNEQNDLYLTKEYLENSSDKVPLGAAEGGSVVSSLGWSTAKLEQNDKQIENVISFAETKGINSIGQHTSVRESTKDVLNDVFFTGASVRASDTAIDGCKSPKDILNYTSSVGAVVESNITSQNNHERPKEILIDSSSPCTHDSSSKDCAGPGSDYHDSVEDLVTDSAKSDERFVEESSRRVREEYKTLKEKDITIEKYSSRNINVPEEKNLEKLFFKDVLNNRDENGKTDPVNHSWNTVSQPGEMESIDSDSVRLNKDSRKSSGFSGNDASLESFANGQPGACTTTLPDTGICMFSDATDNPRNHTGSEPKEEKDDLEEMMDDNYLEVEGLVYHNLYVQAHSNTVLILLAESQLYKDHDTIKALWKTSLNELGELEVRLNQCHENLDQPIKPDDYGYLVYDGMSNTTKGNLEEPVLKVDHMFCDTAKTVHEQFNNCSSLRSVTLRNSSSAVHCQRSLGQEVYFQVKGSFKSFLGSPSTRDPAFSLEKRASKLLHRDHGVNLI